VLIAGGAVNLNVFDAGARQNNSFACVAKREPLSLDQQVASAQVLSTRRSWFG
jgi:hypothetical protein